MSPKPKPVIVRYMDREVALYFRDKFRDARAVALRDSEAFGEIIFVLEGLGKWLAHQDKPHKAYNMHGLGGSLGEYLDKLSNESLHAKDVPENGLCRNFHTPFNELFQLVVEARNSAFHEGAVARHLTRQAIEISLVLEDALMKKINARHVGDFMVRGPVCAEVWQPVSFIRQNMLVNSFSYLPIFLDRKWHLISDLSVAQYINSKVDNESFDEPEKLSVRQNKRLIQPVGEAIKISLGVQEAKTCRPDDKIATLIMDWEGQPILVTTEKNELLGILTPYDLL